MNKKCYFAAILLVVLFASSPAFAREKVWIDYPLEKLGRGVVNVVCSPFELLIQPYDTAADEGNLAALSYGVFRGIAWTVARVVVGVVDIATFPLPLPGCPDTYSGTSWGYGPIMTPAWVFDIKHNWGNFFYNDDSMVQAE